MTGNLRMQSDIIWMEQILQNEDNYTVLSGRNGINEMPLIKGAKPGTAGFRKNIKSEINAGKPKRQAIAIAYSESRRAKSGNKK